MAGASGMSRLRLGELSFGGLRCGTQFVDVGNEGADFCVRKHRRSDLGGEKANRLCKECQLVAGGILNNVQIKWSQAPQLAQIATLFVQRVSLTFDEVLILRDLRRHCAAWASYFSLM
jgi:hypothetical protein